MPTTMENYLLFERVDSGLWQEPLYVHCVACTMAQRGGDERFYLPARQAAGRCGASEADGRAYGHLRCGQSLMRDQCRDGAAYLAKPERSIEQAAKKDAPER